jgi:hypothetical protein
MECEKMKAIIWEYKKAFEQTTIEIAMYPKNDRYSMTVQNKHGSYGKPSGDMHEIMMIDEWHCSPFQTKTIEIEKSFFDTVFEVIADSLVPLLSAQHPIGLDGDGLIVKIISEEGHRCKFFLWAPSYCEGDRHRTNGIFQTFMQVLELAGLTDWYKAG